VVSEIISIVLLLVAFLLLIASLFRFFISFSRSSYSHNQPPSSRSSSSQSPKNQSPQKGKTEKRNYPDLPLEDETRGNPCPLCEKILHRGERVHSVVYNQGEDRLMNIFGCPWCYEGHPGGAKAPQRERRCPSCGLLLKDGSFAIARVFERPGRKTHIHVLGCPVCRYDP